MRAALALGVVVGCADPAVSLSLQPPSNQSDFDTSCVTTFEMFTDGGNYPADLNDFKSIEIKVDQPQATYADLLNSVRGKFDIPIPATGLSGVEVYGWNGQSGFDTPAINPELAFLAVQKYSGSDNFTVPLVPNMSCARAAVTIRPLDLAAFLGSTPRDCAQGAITGGNFTFGTLTPALYKPETFFWGGVVTGTFGADGTATVQGSTTVGPESCVSVSGRSATSGSTSCLTGPGVCGKAGEYELATLDDTFYTNSIDPAIQAKWLGAVVGAVFDTNRASVAGATVEFDPTKGQLVYVDFDAAAQKLVPVPNATATTASGLFLLYSDELLDVKVTGAGHSTTVRMGTESADVMVSSIIL